MSYATLMVHVDVDAELGRRVAIAADLAERFRAQLIGVAGWAPMSVFLAEEARNDRVPQDFHFQDMKTLLGRKGGAVSRCGPQAQWPGGMAIRIGFSDRVARARSPRRRSHHHR